MSFYDRLTSLIFKSIIETKHSHKIGIQSLLYKIVSRTHGELPEKLHFGLPEIITAFCVIDNFYPRVFVSFQDNATSHINKFEIDFKRQIVCPDKKYIDAG